MWLVIFTTWTIRQMELKAIKKTDHRAWSELSPLADRKYSVNFYVLSPSANDTTILLMQF